ncbi:MAG: energy transducer TonB, partial [Chitinophagaceae bacterium]
FPGGANEWRKYLEKNLDATVPKQKAKDGAYSVIVQFIVDKEGNISDVKTLTKHGYGMEEEGVRVIKKGPKWVPAMQNGKVVKAYRKQPITFYLGKEENIHSGKAEKNFSDNQLRSKVEFNKVVIVGFSDSAKNEKTEPSQKSTNDLHEITVIGYKSENAADNKIFTQTETPPSFPGGEEKWRKYLSVNAKGATPVNNGAPAGTYKVIIQFIVNTDSTITDVKAITNHGYGMEEEALRLIKKGPKWFPAKQNGHIVKAYAQQPITFQVQEEVTNKPITKSN